MTHTSLRHRFPGVVDGWSRFDGPAGTQMVDVAIEAMTALMGSASYACAGGPFAAAQDTADLVDRVREVVGQMLGADPAGVCFGPNMTSLTFAVSRAVGRTLRPGDRIVGTRLDHDANITPWRLAAEQAGATHVLVPFDADTGTLPPENVIAFIDERTKWVTLPGASNLLGTMPDLRPIIDVAHEVGAHVYVDAVALAPHMPINMAELEADAIVSSPYKWYGPHSGVLCIDPELLEALPIYKVRPAPNTGPRQLETGMANFEALAGIEAAARFLMEEGMASVAAAEAELFEPLLRGLQGISGVTVYGPQNMDGRAPTAAFTIDGISPADACAALGKRGIAVWDGHNYAVEAVDQLGLADAGGVIRAGISRYLEPADIDHLLAEVADLAG